MNFSLAPYLSSVRVYVFLLIIKIASSAVDEGATFRCAKDRDRARRTTTDRNGFLPVCMPDGNLYRREQCYRELAIPYCFCVNPVDGSLIAGSVVRGPNVKCDSTNGSSAGALWRADERCGAEFPDPISGEPAQCNPDSQRPCCSKWGWCGNTTSHCNCDGCTTYRIKQDPEAKWRLDGRCGSTQLLEGKPGECDPHSKDPCCSKWGWCGAEAEHCNCPTCVDYRIVKQLQAWMLTSPRRRPRLLPPPPPRQSQRRGSIRWGSPGRSRRSININSLDAEDFLP